MTAIPDPAEGAQLSRSDPALLAASGTRDERRPSAAQFSANTNLYKVAFDESVRRLSSQAVELSGVRQRAIQFVTFTGSAIAFLLGSGLTVVSRSERGLWFFLIAGAGTVAALLMLGFLITLLRPGGTKMATTAGARTIIWEYIERQVPAPAANEGELYRDLAWYNDKDAAANSKILRHAHSRYNLVVILGVAQLLIWVQLVWTIV